MVWAFIIYWYDFWKPKKVGIIWRLSEFVWGGASADTYHVGRMYLFFVSSWTFCVFTYIMHSTYNFYYVSLRNCLLSFLAFSAIHFTLSLVRKKLQTSAKYQRISALSLLSITVGMYCGFQTIRATRSIQYHTYKYVPFYASFWIDACFWSDLKCLLVSNGANMLYSLYMNRSYSE